MTSEFEQDLKDAHQNLRVQREELFAILRTLGDADLSRGRRGGWVIKEVIQHVLDSEWHYTHLIRRLRQVVDESSGTGRTAFDSVDTAVRALAEARAALLAAVGGVAEDDFYRFGPGGGQDYSVLSVLQNVAQHDLEHGVQIDQLRTADLRN